MSILIGPNTYVELELDLSTGEGEELQKAEPVAYVHGYGLLVPGLEARLAGLTEGDLKNCVIAPEEGFGDYDDELVMLVDPSELPPDIEVDDEFEADSEEGEEALFRVVEITEEGVLIDANHPLAGETLHYTARVMSVREATESEVAEAARFFEEARELMDPDPVPAPIHTTESLRKKLN
jgi:FKBP-type peptidyl-prolyl cis-trans isomerase SlyD